MEQAPPPDATSGVRRRGRVTASFVALAALLLAATWLLPWFRLDVEGAAQLEDASRAELEARAASGRSVPGEDQLVASIGRAARLGGLRGTDLATWFDAAADARTDLVANDRGRLRMRAVARTLRGFTLAALLLALLAAAGVVRGLGVTALGLATAVGVVGLVLGLLVRALVEEVGGRGLTGVGLGGHVLVVAGGALVALGLLGVTRTTWWKAWLLALLSLAAVGAWAWHAYAPGS